MSYHFVDVDSEKRERMSEDMPVVDENVHWREKSRFLFTKYFTKSIKHI